LTKTLFLIRHAQALNASPGTTDIDRALTARGERDAAEAGRRIFRRGIRPDGITTSHALRTTTTARIIAAELGFPERSILQEPMLYNTSEEDYFEVIRSFDEVNDVQLLVGHNFTISHVLYQLVGLRTQEMAPCSVAVLSLPVESWSDIRTGSARLLEFFVPS
jgi:phosphohistidine phosphatase